MNKVILGLVFAVSFSLFISSSYNVYAQEVPTCNENSHLSGGNGVQVCLCNDNFVAQEGSNPVTPICIPIPTSVGGMGIPIDSTALLLAGVQGSALWMIPAIVVAGAGIGIFSFKRSKRSVKKD